MAHSPIRWPFVCASITFLAVHIASASGPLAGSASQDRQCPVGDQHEQQLFVNASSGSLCCASAQLFFARRIHGHCPKVNESLRLPFGAKCEVDAETQTYMPTLTTAKSAEHMICYLDGCAAAVSIIIAQARASASRGEPAMILTTPGCKQDVPEAQEEEAAQVPPLERVIIVVVAALCTVVGLATFHCMLAPWWVQSYSEATTASVLGVRAVSARGGGPPEASMDDTDQDFAEEEPSPNELHSISASGPSSLAVGTLPPTSLSPLARGSNPACFNAPSSDAATAMPPERRLPQTMLMPAASVSSASGSVPTPVYEPSVAASSSSSEAMSISVHTHVASAASSCVTVTPPVGRPVLMEEFPAPIAPPLYPQAFGTVSMDTSVDVEALAQRSFAEARARCRGHIVLLCAVGIVSSMVRVMFSAAIKSPAGPSAALVLILCVLQLSSLARTSLVPLPPPQQDSPESEIFAGANPSSSTQTTESKDSQTLRPLRRTFFFLQVVFDFLGDLRVYAGTTLLCELIVLMLFATGAFTGAEVFTALEQIGSEDLASPSVKFLLSQAALCLVLVRLYTAWLAHNLHKLREGLTYVVLPESPKARVEAKQAAIERRRMAQSVLVPAWEPPAETSISSTTPQRPQWYAWLHGGRARALFCASCILLLVITVGSVSLWRARKEQEREIRSTCRTATPGLDFCVQKSYLGLYEEVSNFEQCCVSCDIKSDCQAWSFQKGRCWKMQFDDAPCNKRPDHEDCRCYTSTDRIGGYRPQ